MLRAIRAGVHTVHLGGGVGQSAKLETQLRVPVVVAQNCLHDDRLKGGSQAQGFVPPSDG
ncbi:MAG TPA: hypothetical protein VND67_01415 [Acidimicrobiales bacterium]|nr:hypothetical protein [Acidimicrobiales bacterium]